MDHQSLVQKQIFLPAIQLIQNLAALPPADPIHVQIRMPGESESGSGKTTIYLVIDF